MFRPVAAGLMCLGFVTLGVALSRGQETQEKPKPVDATPAVVEEEPVPVEIELKTTPPVEGGSIQIEIGEDGNAAAIGEGQRIEVREDGVIISTKDGKVIRKISGDPVSRQGVARFAPQTQVADPATREALEKMIANLKDEARKLQAEGKNDELQKKIQSVQALEQLLRPGPNGGAAMYGAGDPKQILRARVAERNPQLAAEIQKLHARLNELRGEAQKQQEGEAHARMQQEIGEVQKQIQQRMDKLRGMAQAPVFFAPVPGAPVQPGTGPMPPTGGPFGPGQPGSQSFPGGPNQPGGRTGFQPYPVQPGAFPPGAPGVFNGWPGMAMSPQQFGGPPEAQALARKAEALSQAADRLREGGLGDQAAELQKQAQKLRVEAEKVRAQAQAQAQPPGFGGSVGPAGGPMDLHRSIHELQEQIQQLRKEVGELKELLQRRQATQEGKP